MRIGFVGLGAVASAFIKEMASRGGDLEILGFDAFYERNPQIFHKRLAEADLSYARSLESLVGNSDIVISTVTTDVAVEVGGQAAAFLRKGQVYVDMNSMSPGKKVELSRIVSPKADFVEAAILGAIATTGASTRILLCGERSRWVSEVLNSHGLNTKVFSDEIGQASLFKMIRSVLSKGIEALLVEMMVSGKACGLMDEVWNDICDFMSKKTFREIGENWVATHGNSASRRCFEMAQVSSTLRDLGIEPIMSMAAERVLKRSADLKIESHFPEKPGSYKDVVDYVFEGVRRK